MDPAQLGASKGSSITHYLILLNYFIVSNLDTRAARAVLASYVDFSKGFNRVSHSKILTRLSDWGTPAWILRVVASYLTERSMIVRYDGEDSSPHPLPGSVAQGCELGQLLFLLLSQPLAFPSNQSRKKIIQHHHKHHQSQMKI